MRVGVDFHIDSFVADMDLPSPMILTKSPSRTRDMGYGMTKIGHHPGAVSRQFA